jgi:phosphocarrier protein FPr
LDATTFGTDAAAVASAVEEADSADGVLVLMDLGSAVLSADMAKELLAPPVADRVALSAAPFVEGLLAAVVTASTGASLDTVAREAEDALASKAQHLGQPAGDAVVPTHRRALTAAAGARDPAAATTSTEVTLTNEHGLHARPGARLVSLVSDFDAVVTAENLSNGRGPVEADSVIMLAVLGAEIGHRVRFAATGPDADAVIRQVSELAARNFGDE